MTEQAPPPPVEPAAETPNGPDNDDTAPNTVQEAQETTTTEADLPLDGEPASTTADPEPPAPIDSEPKDTDTQMTDAPSEQPPSSSAPNGTWTSAPGPIPASNAPSPTAIPPRVSTPMRNTSGTNNPNGGEGERTSSRAASAHPDPGFTMPAEAPVHGAPVRQYINTKITGVLLEGMKMVAREQPKDPLRMLGEFLLQKSKELEGTAP